MKLVSGPFRSLSGYWSFTDLGSEGCKVALSLRYQFKSVLLERVVGPVFREIADTLVEAFVRRADAKFGRE
jgi:ribosome-associated toxin RatA of RatAB toxin-antitoxin module